MTTNYVTLRNNYFGNYQIDPVSFIPDVAGDLENDIVYTLKSDVDLTLSVTGYNSINFGAVTNAKMIFIKCDSPITIRLNGGVEETIVDPICILTNQAPTAASLTALQVQVVQTLTPTNINVRIRG